jgi:hypothetical protein
LITAGGLRDRLLRRLSNARSALRAAATDINEYHSDSEVISMLAECREALDILTRDH